MKSKLLIAAEWLWSTRGRSLWLHPNTLTDANAQGPTAPRLSPVEAVGVFKFLEDRKLIFPERHESGQTVYCLHELKEAEWNDALAELRWPIWMRSKSARLAGKLSIWFLSLVIAGFIGGVSRKAADDFYDGRKATVPTSKAVSQTLTESNAYHSKTYQASSPSHTPTNTTSK